MFKGMHGGNVWMESKLLSQTKKYALSLGTVLFLVGCTHNDYCERIAENGNAWENRYCICQDINIERELRRLINAGYEGEELKLELSKLQSYNCGSSAGGTATGPGGNRIGGGGGSSSASAGGGEANASATENGSTSSASAGNGSANSSAGPTNEPAATASAGGGSASASGGASGTVSSGNP